MKYDLNELNTEYANKKFGLLTIIRVFKDDKYDVACECNCDCGSVKVVALRKIKYDHVKSCGCYSKSIEKHLMEDLGFLRVCRCENSKLEYNSRHV